MRPTLVLAATLCFPLAASAAPVRLEGLHGAAEIARDQAGTPHLRAGDEHDLILLQGWVHAQDRFFQTDVSRRPASGTPPSLPAQAALPARRQLRAFRLRPASAHP